jgi:hypothetical protein
MLESRGYHYLVLNKSEQVAYAQKEPIAPETLRLLGLEQLEIKSIQHYQFLLFNWVQIRVD